VQLVGWLGDVRVVESSLQTSFVDGETARVRIDLKRACKAVTCEDGETCVDGACVPIGAATDAGMQDAASDDGGIADASMAEAAAGDGAPVEASTDAAASAGDPPICTIQRPELGDTYQVGVRFELGGSCSDPETGALSAGLVWRSDLDGDLASGGVANASLTRVGSHSITLCAPDPVDDAVDGCSAVSIQAVQTAQPSAAITRVAQGASTLQPFTSAAPIEFEGSASGAGISLSWNDSLQGNFGSGESASLDSPVAGKHLVTLTVTDRDNRSASKTVSFTALAPGQFSSIERFTTANLTLAAVTTLLEGPPGILYAASASSGLYSLDSTNLASPATPVLSEPPLAGVVQDAFRAPSAGLVYFGTAHGLTVCGYGASSGVSASCSSFAGGEFPDDSVGSVLRVTTPGSGDKLLIGTAGGLLSADSASGSSAGTARLDGRSIRAMLADAGWTWIATDQGLYRYAPVSGQSTRVTSEGAPSASLTALAQGANGTLWVGSSNGLGRYAPAMDSWSTAWRTTNGLVNNQINSVAVEPQIIDGATRDVVWIATNGGVSRFDARLGTFTSFTTSDGLPSVRVSKVLVLADGSKLFATDAGVARYTAP
jgi:hypothetical protein